MKLSTSALLNLSFDTINQIKSLIADKNAYLVPEIPSRFDVKVAVNLDIPIFGATVETYNKFSDASSKFSLLEAAQVPVPLYRTDIKSEHELVDALSLLILNEDTTRWIIKINKEFSSRGIAWVAVTDFPAIIEIKNSQEAIEFKLAKAKLMVKKLLSRVVKYAVPSLYLKWEQYVKKLEKFGAAIESMPDGQFQSVVVSFIQEPYGSQQLIGTFDRVKSSDFVNIGQHFPQSILPSQYIKQLLKHLGEALYHSEYFGHVNVELIVFDSPINTSQLFTVIDVELKLGMACQFYLYDFLLSGKMNFKEGKYYITLEDEVPQILDAGNEE